MFIEYKWKCDYWWCIRGESNDCNFKEKIFNKKICDSTCENMLLGLIFMNVR